MLCTMGTMMVRKDTRTAHQNTIIAIIGIIARPAPRSTADRQWVKASRQKNNAQVRAFCTPKAMAAGSEVNARISIGADTKVSTPMTSAMSTEHRMPNRAPFLVRSYSCAPRFWLTKVVIAAVKLVMGRNAKPSILEYAPQPAMAMEPKALMLDCTTTLAKAMMELDTPEGRPYWMIILRIFQFIRSSLMRT